MDNKNHCFVCMTKIDNNEIVCSSRRCKMVLREFNEQERRIKTPELPIQIEKKEGIENVEQK